MKSNKKDELTTGCSCNEIFSSSPGNLNWGYFMYFGNISKHVQHFLENKQVCVTCSFYNHGKLFSGEFRCSTKTKPKKGSKSAKWRGRTVSPSGFHSAGCSLCANATTLFPSIPHIPDFVGVCRVCLRDLSSSRTMLLSKTQMTWSRKPQTKLFLMNQKLNTDDVHVFMPFHVTFLHIVIIPRITLSRTKVPEGCLNLNMS